MTKVSVALLATFNVVLLKVAEMPGILKLELTERELNPCPAADTEKTSVEVL